MKYPPIKYPYLDIIQRGGIYIEPPELYKRTRYHRFIYFVRADGLVKIGMSERPRGRLNGIQKDVLPHKLEVLFTFPDTDKDYVWHKRFAHKCVHHEWFALDEADIQAALDIVAEKARRQHAQEG